MVMDLLRKRKVRFNRSYSVIYFGLIRWKETSQLPKTQLWEISIYPFRLCRKFANVRLLWEITVRVFICSQWNKARFSCPWNLINSSQYSSESLFALQRVRKINDLFPMLFENHSLRQTAFQPSYKQGTKQLLILGQFSQPFCSWWTAHFSSLDHSVSAFCPQWMDCVRVPSQVQPDSKLV